MGELKPQEVQAAITYFEDAVRESDEIIADCTPALQAELTEQKQHFVVALEVMRRATPESKALTITFPCQIGDTVWMVGTVSRRDTEYTPYEYVLAVSTGFVREYGIYTGHWGAVVETKGGSFCYPLSEFDKSIFTSKGAAEQALAARKLEQEANHA